MSLIEARRGLETRTLGSGHRILRSPLGTHDPDAITREATFLRFVSVTEAYVDRLLVELVSPRVTESTPLDRLLFGDFEIQMARSWPARSDAYRRYLGIRLGSSTQWDDLMLTTRIRNCLAHGLGRLGVRERASSSFAQNVRRSLSIDVGGNRVHLSAESVGLAYAVLREFIRWLDGEAATV